MTEDCTALASALYDGAISTIVPVSSPRVAEMVKLLENTFRAVNIGMVNELALMCDRMGIDVWEVVKAASTKPFGFMAFYPGPGLGGHCIPVDPFYLSWKARESGFEARFIELAGAVNGNMPHYVVSLMSEALNSVRKPLNGSKVLVAGIAYKKDVDDIRESPALDLLHLLRERGAELSYTDPFVPTLPAKEWPNGVDLVNTDVTKVANEEFDCVVVVTDHSQFDYTELQRVAKTVVDTRNAIKTRSPKVVRLGAARQTLARRRLRARKVRQPVHRSVCHSDERRIQDDLFVAHEWCTVQRKYPAAGGLQNGLRGGRVPFRRGGEPRIHVGLALREQAQFERASHVEQLVPALLLLDPLQARPGASRRRGDGWRR